MKRIKLFIVFLFITVSVTTSFSSDSNVRVLSFGISGEAAAQLSEIINGESDTGMLIMNERNEIKSFSPTTVTIIYHKTLDSIGFTETANRGTEGSGPTPSNGNGNANGYGNGCHNGTGNGYGYGCPASPVK